VLQALRPDLIVSPLFGPGPLHRIEAFARTPHVVSMPDAFALDQAEALPAAETERRRAVYDALPRVTRVVTISEYSRARLLHHLPLDPARVSVVAPGVEARPAAPGTSLVEEPFVLYPARHWAHKQHAFLLDVMDEVWRSRPDLTLVLTGEHPSSPAGGARTRHRRDRVVNRGYVGDEDLAALYGRAEALVFPSSFEGFGLPVLEAMAAGCPVVCSDIEVLRDLTAGAALVQPADSVPGWVGAIVEELPRRRAELVAAGQARARAFTLARMRRGWSEQLQAAGLRLDGASPRPSLAVPLGAVQAELMLWADLAHHADERLKVIAGLQAALEELRGRDGPARWSGGRRDGPGPVPRLTVLVQRALFGLRRAGAFRARP
jgi:glycosyltransferase involved in cell wall biosynthesis